MNSDLLLNVIDIVDLVNKIRNILPNCSLSTDIIVGFPGETDEDFEETLDMMNTIKFDFGYKFKYSSRPGTKASEYTNQIPENIKQKRLEKLIDLQQKITLLSNKNRIGKIEEIIIEKESKKSVDFWSGRTEGNIWTIIPRSNEKIKDKVKVLITDARGVTLFGKKINNKDMV